MEQPAGPSQPQPVPWRPGMPDRRRRKPDKLALTFRWLTLLVYPLLILCVLVFVALADAQQRRTVVEQMGQPAAAQQVPSVGLKTLLPILIAGLVIGVVGLLLSRLRARRRSDYNYQTQLILVVISVGGLLVFFILQQQGFIR